jgi:pyrimidine-nucleoside phosphorylase
MVSGRGLSITGGTLDKLESVPGFTAHLKPADIVQKVQEVGCVVCSAGDLATADDHMYSLRDVTATVDSLQLITASILSKKLAEGISALVLDVKFGSAATTTGYEASRELAVAMVRLGNDCGVNTRALLTDMESPLGRAAGNWVEVVEAVECLDGRGPDDLRRLVVEEAASLLIQTGRCGDIEEARRQASECLESGAPRRKWEELLAAQGADVDALNRKLGAPERAPVIRPLKADRSGFVTRCNAKTIGTVVRDLGAGRLTREDILDLDVGVDRLMKPGDAVAAGETLVRVHARTEESAEKALQELARAFGISDEPPAPRPLVAEVIEPSQRS